MTTAAKSIPPLNDVVAQVTARIRARSQDLRGAYLARLAPGPGAARGRLPCANFAHGFAASGDGDKAALRQLVWPNIAIVSAYNDILSAHQPLERFPALIKMAAHEAGAVAQFAGGVPAMCDGVTQGMAGMELSLFSRDVIAMSTAVALAHGLFDAALCLGVCDKIVPGLLIGALAFGGLPVLFVPGGPMPSGLGNHEKARVRQLHAQGEVSSETLLESEAKSYHAPGTCTFYGTANSNQMLMEIMGLHLPGAAFVPPNTPLRDALTRAAAHRAAAITALGPGYLPLCRIVDERALVNAIVGLLATGGSTNHTIHLVAIARSAGIFVTWDDFSDLSAAVPLLARIYPNGSADINHFHAAGGMGFLIRELLDAGLLHPDSRTVMGTGLAPYTREPQLRDGRLCWRDACQRSGDLQVLRPVADPFSSDGGLKLLQGNLGRAIIKTSALQAQHRVVEAPARVFDSQQQVSAAFAAGDLERDVVVVVRFQGPRANGMPELHALTPALAVLQKRGHRVALVTDGRMSGASGNVPAAIHLTPECLGGGPIGRVCDGDLIRLDSVTGTLEAKVPEEIWRRRELPQPALAEAQYGCGRELFGAFRQVVADAECGALACTG
ncbi:MAG TPA: phosphogluconate dehydratase [Steroidobacteraceae bacterium]|nr:phosphogluconate dehydratase [Steroidobacteraceae bacterium]